MKPWVNYHHLVYFKTIASESGIARAADKLRLGQPTLSAQLRQFEETIGVKLFDRQHKKWFSRRRAGLGGRVFLVQLYYEV